MSEGKRRVYSREFKGLGSQRALAGRVAMLSRELGYRRLTFTSVSALSSRRG